MECHACGRDVDASDRFCNGCGAAVDAAATTPAAATSDAGRDPDGTAATAVGQAGNDPDSTAASTPSDAPSEPSGAAPMTSSDVSNNPDSAPPPTPSEVQDTQPRPTATSPPGAANDPDDTATTATSQAGNDRDSPAASTPNDAWSAPSGVVSSSSSDDPDNTDSASPATPTEAQDNQPRPQTTTSNGAPNDSESTTPTTAGAAPDGSDGTSLTTPNAPNDPDSTTAPTSSGAVDDSPSAPTTTAGDAPNDPVAPALSEPPRGADSTSLETPRDPQNDPSGNPSTRPAEATDGSGNGDIEAVGEHVGPEQSLLNADGTQAHDADLDPAPERAATDAERTAADAERSRADAERSAAEPLAPDPIAMTERAGEPGVAVRAVDASSAADDPASWRGPDGQTGERTQLITLADDDEWEEPAWATTGSVPEQSVATGDLPATEPITEVWTTLASTETDPPNTTPYDFAEREVVATTGQIPEQPTMTVQMPAVAFEQPVEPRAGFHFGAVMLIALVGGVLTLGAMFADIIVITSDVRLTVSPDAPDTFRTGTWIADDLADNLSIAGLVVAILMVAGGVASAFGWRWGSGLAGGAGLAMAGVSALTVGLAQFPIDAARQFARIPTDDPFVLTITRDLGYWLLVVGGALGVVLFFASINDAFGDRRAGLNPWIAAMGALAVVVAATGPMINENQALFSDNWYLVDAPGEPSAILLAGRLIQLALVVLGGVFGFLSVGRWGLGMVAGSALPSVWLTLSVMFDLGDSPVGPGFRNPGASDMHVHGVTIIGISAVVAMLVLAMVGAYDQAARERPI